MNFKHSCFTENSPENREWLEQLGYINLSKCKDEFLKTYDSSNEVGSYSLDFILRSISEGEAVIDCRSNPSLFKAVSATREDSDYMQWFCSPLFDELELCEIDMFYAPSEYEFHKASFRTSSLLLNPTYQQWKSFK